MTDTDVDEVMQAMVDDLAQRGADFEQIVGGMLTLAMALAANVHGQSAAAELARHAAREVETQGVTLALADPVGSA